MELADICQAIKDELAIKSVVLQENFSELRRASDGIPQIFSVRFSPDGSMLGKVQPDEIRHAGLVADIELIQQEGVVRSLVLTKMGSGRRLETNLRLALSGGENPALSLIEKTCDEGTP